MTQLRRIAPTNAIASPTTTGLPALEEGSIPVGMFTLHLS